jgi:site-specific DNA-adenine methylase
MKKNKLFNYAGTKEFLTETVNSLISQYCPNYKIYIEPFVGSGSIFYNLDNIKPALINDLDFNIYTMHCALQRFTWTDYVNTLNFIYETFGDVKKNKEAYYAFRNSWNERYWQSIKEKQNGKSGLELLFLSSSCINSMLRFGPNGMNQSFGGRLHTVNEENFMNMKSRIKCCKITNTTYEKVIPTYLNSVVIFFDPPYVDREMTYNKGFDQNMFLTKLKELNGTNSLVMYTDFENTNSDELLKYGFKKHILRVMKNISPNRKTHLTGNEVIYFKQF